MPLLVNTCKTVNIMIYSSNTNPDPNLYNYQNVDLRWNQSLFKVIQVKKITSIINHLLFSHYPWHNDVFAKCILTLIRLHLHHLWCVSLLDACAYILLFTLIHLTPELLDLSEISTDPVNPIMVQPWKEQIYVSNSNLYQS